MQTLIQDVRYGARMLGRNPGFTAVAVLTLALGIGANTTIFSWINSTLLDPIPGVTHTADCVAFVRGERGDNPSPPCSYLDYLDMRERNRSFSGLMAYHDDWMVLTSAGRPERIYGALATANYFDVLGVRPFLGRGFLPEEEQKPGGAPVAVISYGLWQRYFAADPTVLGRTVEINRHPYTVVGIAPPAFQGSKTGVRVDVWIPLVMDQLVWGAEQLRQRDNFWLNVLGRLNPGIARRQAQAEMNLLMQQIAEQYPDSHRDSIKISLDPLWNSPIGANSILHVFLPMLMAIAGVVLLLACANVANLLLVRSVARRREIAIRLSMGASRWRLVRQLLVESLLLALAGGGVALWLTTWTSGTLGYFIPPIGLPVALDGHVDLIVLLVTLVFAVLTSVLFGILPALRFSRLCPSAVLKEESGNASADLHKSWLASTLVVAQISLSMLLLICAGLFIRSLQNAQRCDPGFDPNHVLLSTFDLLPAGYSGADGLEFNRQLLAKLEALPGVESVTLADWVPLCYRNRTSFISPEGYVPKPHESMEIGRANVGPNYLRTLRIPLVAGRDLTAQDTDKTPRVALVNQALADRYWPGLEPLGKRIRVEGQWFSVVGVARNSKCESLQETPLPRLYLPLAQNYYPEATLHVRVSGEPLLFASAVAQTIHELNPDLPIFDVTTLKARTQVASFLGRIARTMVGAFGLLALLLAAIGIYGVVAYTTGQRTREIGVRMALGARPGNVLWLVLGQGVRLTLAGLGIGLALSLAGTRFLRAQLLGVTTADALTYVAVSVLLGAVALLACCLPALQATRVNPMAALRAE